MELKTPLALEPMSTYAKNTLLPFFPPKDFIIDNLCNHCQV
jgi:hypothetical protein